MARVKLSSRVALPASVLEAQNNYKGEVKGFSEREARAIYDKVKCTTPTPESL